MDKVCLNCDRAYSERCLECKNHSEYYFDTRDLDYPDEDYDEGDEK